MNIAIAGIRGIPAQYGGFETSAEETATRLVNRGHNVTVYCRSLEGVEKIKSLKGIELIFLPVISSKSFETIFHSLLVGLHILFSRNT